MNKFTNGNIEKAGEENKRILEEAEQMYQEMTSANTTATQSNIDNKVDSEDLLSALKLALAQ